MIKLKKIKRRIFDIIQIGNREDVPSTAFDIFISICIVASIVMVLLHTFDSLDVYRNIFSAIEFGTIIIFIIEYLLRIYTVDCLYEGVSYPKAVVKFVFSFYGIIDLLTIISFFVPVIYSTGVVALRMLRVVRIFRLFAIAQNYDAFNIIFDVLMKKLDQLLSSLVMIFMLMMFSSVCMYSLEHPVQPDVFKNAFSGFWWSVSTILTVGYGDMYPITIGGRICAIIISFLGVGLVAIPTAIISAGFVEHYNDMKDLKQIREKEIGGTADDTRMYMPTLEEIRNMKARGVYIDADDNDEVIIFVKKKLGGNRLER